MVKWKILIVDDSSATRAKLSHELKGSYEVFQAKNGVEALAMIKQNQPDCILTDQQMPEMDGSELCVALRASEEFRIIPIIMLTGSESIHHFEEAIRVGADDQVSKAGDPRVLKIKIQGLLRVRRLQLEIQRLTKQTAMQSLIATYNHEFNNPLYIMQGNLNIIRQICEKSHPQVQKSISVCQGALDRIKENVKKISEATEFAETAYSSESQMVDLKKSS